MSLSRIKLLSFLFSTFLAGQIVAQCPFTFTLFGGQGTAPSNGNSTVMDVCSMIGEVVTTTGVVAGETYCIDFDYNNTPFILPYVVIYDSTYSPVAFGFSPISFTAPSSGTYHAIPFLDDLCTDLDLTFSCITSTWTHGLGSTSTITETATACESYIWTFNNQMYTVTGIYTDSVMAPCGNLVMNLDLTIVPNSFNFGVTNTGGVLTSNQNTGTYQWIDCTTNSPISGEVNQSYAPTQTGSYAVILSDSVCSDTSACTAVQVLGLSGATRLELTISPNPTYDQVTILFEGEILQLTIADINGKQMYSQQIQNGEQVDFSSFPKGVYLCKFQTSENSEIHRIVRQ